MNRDVPIGYLAISGSILHPSDSLAHAVELLQSSPSGAVPVMEDGFLRGLVSDREIAGGIAAGNGATVGSVMTQDVPIAAAGMTAGEALGVLAGIAFPALPVVTGEGQFLGTVGRGELLATLHRRRRPNPIGGMATPLGVYLSDGRIRGGVGDVGLALTGVFLFVGWFLSAILAEAALRWWYQNGMGAYASGQTVSLPLFLLAFAAWFRLSPVAGYHAAEHQTVHAIERNEPLTPERVAAMPRPHPRCGTNLVVLFSMFSALVFGTRTDPVVAALASLVAYRFFGQWVQKHVTTRPASCKQLLSGIRAGEQLLERYQGGSLPVRHPGLQRLWNAGILQVGIGYAAVFLVLRSVTPYVPFVRDLARFLQ